MDGRRGGAVIRRGLGHLPDRASDKQSTPHVHALIGAGASLPPLEVDASTLLTEVPDQGPTSACVGASLATSIYLHAKTAGRPIDRPSAAAIYALARLGDGARHPLPDTGSRPTLAMVEAQTNGLVADARWPLRVDTVLDVPPLDVFENGLDAKLDAYYAIPSGPGAAALIRRALAAGCYPIFATPVDEAYERYVGGIYVGCTGTALGGHMQCLVGYDAKTFMVANSWGPQWGAGGFARVSADWLESYAVTDILVPTTAPARVT